MPHDSGNIRTARLTEADVLGLRARISAGLTTPIEEADRFGLAPETIRKAYRGETFRFVGSTVRRSEQALGERLSTLAPSEEDAKASLRRLLAQQAAEARAKVDSDRMMDELFSDAAIEARRRAAEAGVAARGLDPSLRDEPPQERIGNALED